MAISFQTEKTDFKLKKPAHIRKWINAVCLKEKRKPGEISFVFMSDAGLLKRNIEYLNHDTLTDIITFDYSEDKIINGDILISIERVRENALKFDTDFDTELHRVMIHGILHLCGYKDKKSSDKELMRKKEGEALKKFKNPN
jgi:rRNA maturation RNase YbeY